MTDNNAQHYLLYLEITCLDAVVGPMGGMQALLWSMLYPKNLKCIVIASSASLPPQALAFGTVARNAIISDKEFNQENYTADSKPKKGLAIGRMMGHITYLSKESITKSLAESYNQKKL